MSDLPEPADRWDAGDAACGELALALRNRVRRLAPGDCIELITKDPGAPEDVPAWCRLTGHVLLSADHPIYLIARKDDS